jgi:hypothetical protein
VPSLTLSIVLFFSIIIAFVASSVMLIVQIALERERAEREALASQARRLRNRADHKEIRAPSLMNGLWFHTFLSHVWGTVHTYNMT